MRRPLRVFLIGCGRVGTAVALGLKRGGHRVVGAGDIDPRAERRARKLLGLRTAGCRLQDAECVAKADVILVATPDSAIERVSRQIVHGLRPNQTIVHFSGALSAFRQNGSSIGTLAMHPVMTFPSDSPKDGPGLFRNCHFALEGNARGLALGRRLVRDLGGKAFTVQTDDKPLFHAACVFVSNFVDAVVDAGLRVAQSTGMTRQQAWRVLEPLVEQTLLNIGRAGTVRSLTGPVERGDAATIQRHLAVLRRKNQALVPMYRMLSSHALTMALGKHSIPASVARKLRRLLR